MKNEEMALLFSEATPYIQKYHGKTMVIKYGGNAMINETLKNAVMNDLVTLTLLGVRVEHDPCEECGGICRTLVVEEGARFQALPSGLLMDGILRMAFSVIAPEGGCSGSCGSCSGCCG